jgi:hypothetical protein
VTTDPDAFAIWGDWDLDGFKVLVLRWRDTTNPPAEVYDVVRRWWPRLKQPAEWSGAARVSRDRDLNGNLMWTWVPGADWLDDEHGYFRVQCWFRVHENDKPPRLVCDEIRTHPSLSPTEVDRADGFA